MSLDFKESEWKILRKLNPVALERFCKRILAELQYIASAPEQTYHERHLAVFKTLRERDDEMAVAFDNLSRSKALFKLAHMNSLGLVTDEELAQFRNSSPD